MTYHGLVDTLVKDRGYPKSMHELTEEQLNFPMNGAVCDFKTGCSLKLGADNTILRGFHGFQQLSIEEVNAFITS
jgi:hypothetical protein